MTTDKQRWTADVESAAEERRQMERELAELKERAALLERELEARDQPTGAFPGFYTAYYATTGFMLGIFGACTSLLINVIGALLVPDVNGGHHLLRLIQVYLTFPLGANALHIDDGLTLAVGCCLYLGTGMLLGSLFQVYLSWFSGSAALGRRLLLATAFSLALWIINFYGILSWLQPLLFGGRWIVDMIPPWVAAATHLVFGWTMAVVYPWGLYVPYQVESEKE